MARYTDDSRDRVRDAVDMADLVGTRVELRRAGVNRMEGLCPFHDERTPSFGINPAEKLFYCFGCGEGGDAFKFVQLTEGVDFKGSLEYLADRYGVELEVVEEDAAAAERRKERDRLLELLERTAAFYVRYLWDSEEAAPAREYLAGRGLEEGALREFRVGYAPSAWDKVLLASRRAGFSDRELVAAGLAQRAKGEGRTYDRFRRRIMFPLCDSRGRVLGFGARAMGVDQKPKYLNSSDNAVYHKGRHLFGADIARAVATKAGTVILVEGYTDVVAMHQAGLRNTVGVMGTALTDEQVQEIPRRLAPKAIIALDADTAGQAAMVRAARLGKRRGLEFEVAPLPPNKDPADLLKEEGPRAIAQIMDAPIPFARFRVLRELDMADLSSAQGKQAALKALSPVFAELEIGALRDELVRVVSDRVDLSPELTESLLAQDVTTNGEPAASRSPRSAQSSDPARALAAPERAERAFLSQCLAAPSAGREALHALDLQATFTSGLTRRAAAHVRDRLSGGATNPPPDDDALAQLMAELVVKAGQLSASEAAVESERLGLELLRIDRDIRAAQQAAAGDVTPLVAQRQDLRRRRDAAIARAIEETHVVTE